MNSSSQLVSIDKIHKIIFIGDSGVGKTSIMTRYVDDTFNQSSIASIGVDFKIKRIQIDGVAIKQQLWDTSGQERFRTITKNYYRGCHGIVFVFDVTKPESFSNLTKWVEEADKYNENLLIQRIIIGNKTDLENERQVAFDIAFSMAASLNMEYYETSARNSKAQIDEAMVLLSKNIVRSGNESLENSNKNGVLLNKPEPASKKGRCC